MALPSTGAISLSQVNQELGRSATATISLNESAVRALAGVSSGSISMGNLRGKSSSLLSTTITIGRSGTNDLWGYSSGSMGSLGNVNVSGRTISSISYSNIVNVNTGRFSVQGSHTGSWWGTINVGGTVTSRTGGGSVANGETAWTRGTYAPNSHLSRNDILGGRRSGTHSLTIE